MYKALLGQNVFFKFHIMIFLLFAILYHNFKQEEDKDSLNIHIYGSDIDLSTILAAKVFMSSLEILSIDNF